jgi:hypothetical protein
MKVLMLCFIQTAMLVSVAYAQEATIHLDKELGLEYIGHPPGFSHENNCSGMMLEYANTEYGLSIYKNGEHRIFVYFEKKLGREDQKTKWKVLDAVMLPAYVNFDSMSHYCSPASVSAEELSNNYPQNFRIGMVTSERGVDVFRKIRGAWKINWDSFKIEEVPASSTVCYPETEDEEE